MLVAMGSRLRRRRNTLGALTLGTAVLLVAVLIVLIGLRSGQADEDVTQAMTLATVSASAALVSIVLGAVAFQLQRRATLEPPSVALVREWADDAERMLGEVADSARAPAAHTAEDSARLRSTYFLMARSWDEQVAMLISRSDSYPETIELHAARLAASVAALDALHAVEVGRSVEHSD